MSRHLTRHRLRVGFGRHIHSEITTYILYNACPHSHIVRQRMYISTVKFFPHPIPHYQHGLFVNADLELLNRPLLRLTNQMQEIKQDSSCLCGEDNLHKPAEESLSWLDTRKGFYLYK